MSRIHPVYAQMPTTVFEAMSGLARELGAINLGQGFPDDFGPPELIEAAARALREKTNQYPPAAACPNCAMQSATFYRRQARLELTREQVVVTSGATEAIADAVLALVRPGDEVILFQPAYDAYAPMVRRAGGRAGLGGAAPAGMALSGRRPGRCDHAQDAGADAQRSAQSGGHCGERGGAGNDCRGLRRARSDRNFGRGLGGCPL